MLESQFAQRRSGVVLEVGREEALVERQALQAAVGVDERKGRSGTVPYVVNRARRLQVRETIDGERLVQSPESSNLDYND